MQNKLVLASKSQYKQELMKKLGLPFEVCDPAIDESPRAGETPEQLANRLAEEKARACADEYPDALIVAADQVADLEGRITGKPGTSENAVRQLQAASGKTVTFFTGLCLLNTATGESESSVEQFSVKFRELSLKSIERYVRLDKPLECAGAFKAEGLGITLFSHMRGDDPNTLIGLPLIRLVDFLHKAGVTVP